MKELEIEVFRTGNFGEKGRYEEKDIEQIANDYDPAIHEAPVTIDHAQKGPAFGWVKNLRKKGDTLVARITNLNEKFLDLVKNGTFKKRSIELYKKIESNNQETSFRESAKKRLKKLQMVNTQENTKNSKGEQVYFYDNG